MKKIVCKFIIGGFIGIAVSHIIALIISLSLKQHHFYPVNPSLIAKFGTELNATLAQTLAAFCLGGVYSALSLIFQVERLSMFKQTLVHFLISTSVFFIVAITMNWLYPNALTLALFLLIYLLIYIAIWFLHYMALKTKIAKINASLSPTK